MDRDQRVTGAVVGSAVGDALGAPFEFSRERTFSTRFPQPDPGNEMCGGGSWEPGEATDDTQMAVHLAESLLERDGMDLPDIFARFQRWATDDPMDIGLQTESVLTNGHPWDLAAAVHFQTNHRAAGNGSLMRATTSAVYFARAGQRTTMDAARRMSALTHGDPAAWEGTAIFHELVRIALDGGDPLAALPDILPTVTSYDGEYQFANTTSGKCLAAEDDSGGNPSQVGDRVELETCNSKQSAQMWNGGLGTDVGLWNLGSAAQLCLAGEDDSGGRPNQTGDPVELQSGSCIEPWQEWTWG
jgi:ADP-ribosylglycohydrolase